MKKFILLLLPLIICSQENLDFEFTITESNMTIQISPNVVTFNNEEPPLGSLIGGFFTNDNGYLQCAGSMPWSGTQLAIAMMSSENNLDNGFLPGEEITWALQLPDGQSIIADIYEMNTSPPFSNTFIPNGFGQLLNAEFNGNYTPLSIQEFSNKKQLIQVVDILNRYINTKNKNTLLLYIYDDGSVEKKYVIE